MATPLERLNELRAIKSQSAPKLSGMDRLNQLREMKLNAQPAQSPQKPIEKPQDDSFFGAGVIEPAANIISGAIAEPIAGIAGIVQAVNPFAEAGAGERAINATRKALTINPSTQAGKENLQSIGETLAPVGKVISSAEKTLGDTTFELTGSPALAAFATSLPAAALEIIGLKGGGRLARKSASITPSGKAVKSLLNETAPSSQKLREVSGQVFKELQDSGVNIKPNSYKNLVKNIEKSVKGSGFSRRTTKDVAGLIDDMRDVANGAPVSLNEIADLRKVAQGVAGKLDPTEKMLSLKVIDEIDSFIDDVKPNQLTSGNIKAGEIGSKYNAARKLYGRAKKSELVTEAINTAKERASGFENGIRIELGKLIKNKRTKNFFTKPEKTAIAALKQGDFAQNFSKVLGRFAFNEGRSTNMLNALAGAGVGGAVGGGFGAIAVPVAGTVARKISQNITKGKADFVDTIIRAGSDGEAIAKAYIQSVPKSKRNLSDLTELLSDPNIDLSPLMESANARVKQAAEIAAGRQIIGQAIGTGAASAAKSATNEQKSEQP